MIQDYNKRVAGPNYDTSNILIYERPKQAFKAIFSGGPVNVALASVGISDMLRWHEEKRSGMDKGFRWKEAKVHYYMEGDELIVKGYFNTSNEYNQLVDLMTNKAIEFKLNLYFHEALFAHGTRGGLNIRMETLSFRLDATKEPPKKYPHFRSYTIEGDHDIISKPRLNRLILEYKPNSEIVKEVLRLAEKNYLPDHFSFYV